MSDAAVVICLTEEVGYFRLWHLSDLLILTADVGYEGVKQKWLGHRQTDAFDPTRTLPLRHPGHAHTLGDTLFCSEECGIVAQ
jgi:hypothetical protein